MSVVLAVDLGSTQMKLLLMNEHTDVVYVDTQAYPTQAPRAGWLEQRPSDWIDALRRGMQKLSEEYGTGDIAAVSFSGHMSGVVPLDASGGVLHPCIMLSDSRSETEAESLRACAGDLVRKHSGNPIINAFSLPKLVWLKTHRAEMWGQTAVWLSPKDYVRYCLTGHVATEYTDAYNSLCLENSRLEWCGDILYATGLEKSKFPEVLSPFSPAGSVTHAASVKFGIREGTPVYAGGADMACGAVGMGLYTEGDSALTLGTCATFLAPVPAVKDDCFGQVTFHLHASPGKIYALGSHFNGGLAVNWLTQILSETETLNFAMMDALSEEAERIPPGSDGVLTLPFLAGSGSPYFHAYDRQTILGCSAATTRAQLFRSELEGITMNLGQTRQVVDRLVDGGLRRVLLGGGGAKIGMWPQLIADVFGTRIDLVSNTDASAVGAAIIGGVGLGMFASAEETAEKCLSVRKTFVNTPKAHAAYRELFQKYKHAYAILSGYYNAAR